MTSKPARTLTSAQLTRRAEIGEERRAKTKQKLVDAAYRLFASHGADSPTIDDIVAEASGARGTFYNHFETRDVLQSGRRRDRHADQRADRAADPQPERPCRPHCRGDALFAEPVFDDHLSKISLGSWDGPTMADIDALWPDALDGRTQFDWYFRAPDGESFAAVEARVATWLAKARRTNAVVVAISYGLTGRVIRGVHASLNRTAMLELPVGQDRIWRLHNGEITEIPI